MSLDSIKSLSDDSVSGPGERLRRARLRRVISAEPLRLGSAKVERFRTLPSVVFAWSRILVRRLCELHAQLGELYVGERVHFQVRVAEIVVSGGGIGSGDRPKFRAFCGK